MTMLSLEIENTNAFALTGNGFLWRTFIKMKHVAGLSAVVCAVVICTGGCSNEEKPIELSPVTPLGTIEPPPTAMATPPSWPTAVPRKAPTPASAPKGADVKPAKDTKTLVIEDLKKGTGDEAKAGDMIQVHYRGTLLNGTQFDASYDRGTPFDFKLGGGQVIKGWDEGFAGMKVGGKRRLIVPSDMAYGAQSPSPAIPPNSTLVFEVELLKVTK